MRFTGWIARKTRSRRRAWLFTHPGAVDRAQIYPFQRYRNELGERWGLSLNTWDVGDLERVLEQHSEPPTLVFLQDRNPDRDVVMGRVARLRGLGAATRIVLLDCFASTYGNSLWLLPHVDLLVKKAVFRDIAMYERCYLDGRIFADFLIREHGLAARFEGHVWPVTPFREKLVVGWNLGTKQSLEEAFRENDYRSLGAPHRDIDVTCRVSLLDPPQWYALHRRSALDQVARLGDRFHIVASEQRLPRHDYWQELGRSKIAVSPFGWGEICLRDFEAVLHGSLLIKPDMGHLQTVPDIYQPYVTYVPVRWDFSDLAETCAYYLQNDDERRRLTAAATAAYARFFQEQRCVEMIGDILARLGMR